MLGIPVEHWALSFRNWASIEMLQWPEDSFFIILNTSMLVWQLLNHLIQISCDQIYEFQWHLLIQFYETEYSWSQIWSWYLFFWFKHMSIQNTSRAFESDPNWFSHFLSRDNWDNTDSIDDVLDSYLFSAESISHLHLPAWSDSRSHSHHSHQKTKLFHWYSRCGATDLQR